MFMWERGSGTERPEPLRNTQVFDKFLQDEQGWRMVRVYADTLHSYYGSYWQQAFAGTDTVTGIVDGDGVLFWSFDCAQPAELRRVCNIPKRQPATVFASRGDFDASIQAVRRHTDVVADGDQPGHVNHARLLISLWHFFGADPDMTLHVVAEHHKAMAADEQVLFDHGTLGDFSRHHGLRANDR